MNTNEISRVYDTLLSVPSMDEMIKMDKRISRKIILLLSHVIEGGLKSKDGSISQLLSVLPKEAVSEIKDFAEDCLSKAGLKEVKLKLEQLSA
ncbi:hypothetical protein [Pedobacter sp. GR22-10]|uniref:hypothetical protein n=1 Tax=Pedobacter sp. GR22-10 TaxID=2994472 RepID=UPI002245FB0F|nr:hypothetical protein [Pedobacter sp. GR22-10]MCX2429863.1 hypothetical protein [Pedobacter sp. GR22-10]